ncbi:MAG: carbonic anhydrase [Pseudomonadota bacterium]
MEKLVSGIAKFQQTLFESHKQLFADLAQQQNPEILFITCSDSRIDPNMITQSKPGEMFICRNAGNIVPPHAPTTGGVTATIEYAVAVLHVKHIVVCGHTDCGAMKGAMYPDSVKHLRHVSDWLSHCAPAIARVAARNETVSHAQLLELTEENVILQLHHLQTHPEVATRIAAGDIFLHGWVYDIELGEIHCYEKSSGAFVPASEHYARVMESEGKASIAAGK